jgi:hypothetical protein
MENSSLFVLNSKGEKEPFSKEKVFWSVKRAGGSEKIAREISELIEKEIYPGIPTKQIYKKIKTYLKKYQKNIFLRFSLKEAIFKLGPTGFPFEKFAGKIFEKEGFRVEYNLKIKGFCNVIYEIDFLARNNKEVILGECKYHHAPGERVDLKIVLSNQARFMDILENKDFQSLKTNGLQIKTMILTNTKFTSQAIQYAQCKKTELLGWRYPPEKGLEFLIEEKKLYPLTILPSFKGKFRDYLLEKNIVSIDDFFEKEKEIPEEIFRPLSNEAKLLFY